VDRSVHFLLNIVTWREWQGKLMLDQRGQRAIIEQTVPKDSLAVSWADRTLTESTSKGSANLQGFEIRIERSKGFSEFPMPCLHGLLLLGHLWSYMRVSLEQEMPVVLLNMNLNEFAFRELAFGIISLVSGLGSSLSVLDHRRL